MDGKTILPRSEVPEEFTWDLSHVFASDDKWNEELEALKAYPERMAAYAGKLGESAKTLLDWFTLSDEINVRVSKFVQYASCRSDQDLGNSFYQGMRSKAFSTAVALNSAGSFEASEIMAIPDETLARFYAEEPKLETYRRSIDKLRRRGLEVSIDNIYAHIQDVAGIRVICNYLDDIYYLRSLLTRSESYTVLREVDYIKEPKDTGYRSLHLIVNVPIVISEGTMVLPVEIQLRTIAMDMWASLEHELRYKSDRKFTQQDAARLRLCSDAISEIDREMQDIYQGNEPQYHA